MASGCAHWLLKLNFKNFSETTADSGIFKKQQLPEEILTKKTTFNYGIFREKSVVLRKFYTKNKTFNYEGNFLLEVGFQLSRTRPKQPYLRL